MKGKFFFDHDDIVDEEPAAVEERTPIPFDVDHDKYGLCAVNVEFGKSREERNRKIAEEQDDALQLVCI